MTLEEIMDDVWRAAGEPPDLNPDTDIRYGGSPLLMWVANQAQNTIASWKDRDTGGKPKILEICGELFFQSTLISGTLDEDATDEDTIVLPSTDVGAGDDQYNGWIYSDGTEYMLITDYVGSTNTITLHDELSTTPSSGDSYYLYKRFFLILPSTDTWASEHITRPSAGTLFHGEGQLIVPTKIEDMESKRTLEKARREDGFLNTQTSTGDPTLWYLFGNRVVFNYAPEEVKWFRMEYKRLPTPMTSTSDVPEIPEMFHYGIVLWSLEWVFRHFGETGDKYSTKLDFNDFMRSTVSTMELMEDDDESYVYIRRS
jgi:hypothetical protein